MPKANRKPTSYQHQAAKLGLHFFRDAAAVALAEHPDAAIFDTARRMAVALASRNLKVYSANKRRLRGMAPQTPEGARAMLEAAADNLPSPDADWSLAAAAIRAAVMVGL